MKILVLNYEYPPIGGGAAPVAADISRHLAMEGHNVSVVTMAFRDLPRMETVDGVKIHRVKCLRTKAFVSYPWEQLSYLISARGYLKALLQKEQFDIAYVHFVVPTGVLGVWLKKRYKLPFVLSTHGSDVPGHNKNRFQLMHTLLKGAWKKICSEAWVVTAPSDYLRELIWKNDPSVRCEIVPNGIETNVYRQGPKDKSILTLSRLQEHKGVQDVIRAFSAKRPDSWTLTIAGDGPYRAELEKLAAENGVEKSVSFTGWIESKSEQLISILAKASVFVSMSRFESFGLSAAEAIASGCVAVLSDIPAHRFFQQFGAILVPLDDPAALEQALEEAMQRTPTLPDNTERLDWSGIVKNLESYLVDAAKSKNG